MNKFAITMELDLGSRDRMSLINELSNSLCSYFKEKKYGSDIQNYYIGCVCLKTPIGYEEWFKKRKPKYKETKSVKNLDGSTTELKGIYSYDIKIDGTDYDKFISLSENESKKILASEILKSLSNLDELPKKIKDFDKEKFKSDMKQFFKEQKIL